MSVDVDAEDMLMHRDGALLEGLKPCLRLLKLSIIGYRGVKSASWMRSLDYLLSLELESYPNLIRILYNQFSLPDLRYLKVWSCLNLIALPHRPGHLKELVIGHCLKLITMHSLT